MSDPVKAALVNRSHVQSVIDALLSAGGRVRAVETAANAWTLEVFDADIYVVDRADDDTPVGIVRISCQGPDRTTFFVDDDTTGATATMSHASPEWFDAVVAPIVSKLSR